jgi:integrase
MLVFAEVSLGVAPSASFEIPPIPKLSDRIIRENPPLERDFKLADGGGMYLLVRANQQRGWRFKYRVKGKEKLLSFGPYPAVSLAKARGELKRAKLLLRRGVDPSVARKAENNAGANSFEAVAREWMARSGTKWRARYAEKVVSRLERDIFPWIGKQSIKDLQTKDLLTCLKRIEARNAHETAHRACENIAWVFRYAIETHRCTSDPTASLKSALLPTNENQLAFITDPRKLGELLRAIDAYSGSHTVRTALALAPLVFVRPGELRAAEWTEFRFDLQEWRMRARRMPMRVPHIVPLSTQAIALLKDLEPDTGDDKYVFPSPRSRKRPLSNVALLAALRRMGYEQGTVTVQGFRSTASTLLTEKGFSVDWIERQLAHGERDGDRTTFNHTAYLPQRKRMMQEWADYLDELRVSSPLATSRRRSDAGQSKA